MDQPNFVWDQSRPIRVPQHQLPVYRTDNAIRNGVERKLIFKTWGGIGDQICAEPTLRHALKMFKDCEISLASERPEMFKHLQFKRVFDLNEATPNWKNYLVFETITPPDESNLVWQFYSHLLTNCVDFPALCALRSQLPIADREIKLEGSFPVLFTPSNADDLIRTVTGGVLVHPGRHWQSKTFPKGFWDRILAGLKARGITPVIIGGSADDNRGTVDVDATGCLDLRDKLSIMESVWCCKQAGVLLTNDSSPLHMAASGNAWIGYVATCKHPDFITHWRNGVFQWREVNFGKGGIWEEIDYCPNKKQTIEVENVGDKLLEWLPDPIEMVEWAVEKRKDSFDQKGRLI